MASTVKRGSASVAHRCESELTDSRTNQSSAPALPSPWRDALGRWLDVRMTAVLLLLIAFESIILIALEYRHTVSYETYGYDAGLYDQTLWLLGHQPFSSPFLTSRGLPVWGHHVNPILVPLGQLTRLGAGVMFFAALQTVVVFLGALPVSWLTRAKTGSSTAGLAMGIVYLLYPANIYFAWCFFHPELLAPFPMLLMGWFAYQRRFGLMWLAAIVAMACREEVAVAVLGFGLVEVLVSLRRRDRARFTNGVALMVASAAWFAICSKVIIPGALGGQPFYLGTFYGKYGGSYGEIGRNLLSDPSLARGLVTDGNRETFLLDLFGPLGFLPAFGLPIIMVLAPLAGLLMSSGELSHNIQSHYPAMLIAGLFLATIEVIRATWTRRIGKYLLILVVVFSCSASILRSPAPWSVNQRVWKGVEPKRDVLDRAVAMIPADAKVSAIGTIVPHLSHRSVIYQFPNPMERWFYGEFELEDPEGLRAPRATYPTDVDWLIVDRTALGRYGVVLERAVADGTFEIVFDENDVVVARRAGAA